MMSSSSRVGRIAAAVGILTLSLVGCGLQPSARLATPVGPALSQALHEDYALNTPTVAAPVETKAAAIAPTLGVIEIRAVDFTYVPKFTTVERPGRYTVRFINTDELPHDIMLPDGSQIYAEAGQTVEGVFEIGAAGTSFICAVPGHLEAGMVGGIGVVDATVAGTTLP